MLLEEAKLVVDMLESARSIEKYLGDQSLMDPHLDRQVRDAIYWNFTVIGEALNASKRYGELLIDRISESHRIIGFRNQIVHGYANIKHDWTDRTIREKLPTLITELEQLLKEAPPLPEP